MHRSDLIQQIRQKNSFLCVGLDPDPLKIPVSLGKEPSAITRFCGEIIIATAPHCVAFKLNIAFFEAMGRKAWDILYATRELLPNDCFLIADAKRADIGNSSRFYARTFFEELRFDAVTVAPYMGEDSVRPFLEYEDKWTIMLALTSNVGAMDFQMMKDAGGRSLFEHVLMKGADWGTPDKLMFVAGATHPAQLSRVREIVPEHFLLVPGIGAQGGSLTDVAQACMTKDIEILVNSTREIIYASSGEDFAEKAGERARDYKLEMQELISGKK